MVQVNKRIAAAVLGVATVVSPVHAQTSQQTSTPQWDISANVGVTSDYRFRGISLSDKDPAVHGGIDIKHESGLFIGTWASSIANNGGSNAEIDLYGGYGGSGSGLTYSLTALAYVYPGGHDVNYFEALGSVGTSVGRATVGLDVGWVPSQNNFGGDNLYLAGRAEVPLGTTNASLFGHFGYENGGYYDQKLDWEAGISYVFGPLTASLSYVDTNYSGPLEAGRLAKAGAVASLSATF